MQVDKVDSSIIKNFENLGNNDRLDSSLQVTTTASIPKTR